MSTAGSDPVDRGSNPLSPVCSCRLMEKPIGYGPIVAGSNPVRNAKCKHSAMVEHPSDTRKVLGSSPGVCTKMFS